MTRASASLHLGPHGVVAAAFQHVRHFAPATRARYQRLADRDRRFEFVLTFDRDLVVDVTAALVGRVSAVAD